MGEGNVREWTADWYEEDSAGCDVDPSGAVSGSRRVKRGGGWNHFESGCFRAASRDDGSSNTGFENLGFRCVRSN